MDALETLKRDRIVAVIRKANEDNIISIVEALKKGGMNAIEITAETPNIISLIKKVSSKYSDTMLIGAGTVLDAETARSVIMAGAHFIVSPTLNIDTIKLANRYGILSIPGALTPTEILTAYEHGAGIVKVFPADVLGPDYIKMIHGPLPHIPIMVTGGIRLDNLSAYLKKGGVAVGIGSDLVDVSKLNNTDNYNRLTEKTEQFVNKINKIN